MRLRRLPLHRSPLALPLLCALLALAATAFPPARGGTPPRAPAFGEGRWEIASIDFEGVSSLSESELRAQLLSLETPGFLGKFLHGSISEKLGRKNEYYAPAVLGEDLRRLRRYYENHGFSDVRIDTSLAFDASDSLVSILFRVNEGYRAVIDTLVYRGITEDPGTILSDVQSSPRIAVGDPFNAALLEEEVRRVLRIFFDVGYPNATYLHDSSSAIRYTSTRNYAVVLAFRMGRRAVFGPIAIAQEVDTVRGQSRRDDITDALILRHLDFAPGDVYSLDKRIRSEQNLNRLGIFDLRQIAMRIPSDTAPSNLVLSNITIRPRDRHELAPELLISDENGAFNLGTGLGYTNRNFLGDARTFTARARFRTQTIGKFPDYFGRDADAIANLDLTFEVLQPYVFTNRFQGSWSLSFILDKQRRYLQNIFRNKFGVTGRFAEFTTGYLDWTLDAVGLVLNQNFRTDSSDRDLLQQLERLQKQQFNSILSFTIQRDKSNDLFSPSAGFIHSLTVEEAGMLGIALQRVFPRLRYTQFYRINLLGRWYTDLSENRFALLAFKLRAGLIEKYGESKSDPDRVIPQTHIFFAGGGGSVRGWQSRELIAGGVAQLGGAMIMEGSMEVRINPLQGLRDGFFDKIWLVQFLDAGNVWPRYLNFRFRDIAVATGFGFRYDTLFGPFRLDWGLRVYDPARPPGSRWIVERNFVRDTIRESVFHFGIGHAF